MVARKSLSAKPAVKGKKRSNKTPVVPDKIDFRDRLYLPPVTRRPQAEILPPKRIPVLNQKQTNACTGFALATVVHWLLTQSGSQEQVSPFMLYSMARRYDEFLGSKEDTGSSVRGALKGWHKHGVCSKQRWEKMPMPAVPENPEDDWWGDAMRRPLGAYYRIDPKAISDMHVAIQEVGILYASAVCHVGWDKGLNAKTDSDGTWEIPHLPAEEEDGGHAFAIVGYTEQGFIVQNSWGKIWGAGGYAILKYADWRENAMDCWVVQMGVATAVHLDIARAPSLRMVSATKVELAEDEKLRNHEIAPFIVNMENNGELSDSGDFRTKPGDLEALVTTYLERARDEWKLRGNQAADIAIYAHGGLVSEADAAKVAAKWIPALYERNIFPIFLMWETGLVSTLANIVKDWLHPEDERRTAGPGSRWWDKRVERLLAKPGTAIWGEMKENGAAISTGKNSGGLTLYEYAKKSKVFDHKRDRVHLIGHSAGSIVHCHLASVLAGRGWTFATANMMAPAATMELFTKHMLPLVKGKRIGKYNQWHLSDSLETADKTCRGIIGYGRSLLYLVSESFEGGSQTEILGMHKFFPRQAATNMESWTADSPQTHSSSHGGFDDDETTMKSVIRQIEATKS